MDVAATEQYLACRHAHDGAARKQLPEDRGRRGVAPAVEQWHDDVPIGDVIVDVRAREPRPSEARRRAFDRVDAARLGRAHVQRTGLHELVNLEAPAARVARRGEALERVARDAIVRIAPVVAPAQADLSGSGEAGEVVDVPVRLVVVDAAAQPYHHVNPEMVAQQLLDLAAPETGVAVLVQQAFLGGEQRALPVHVDRAALEHERRAVAIGALDFADLVCDCIVEVARGVQATPGVEQPVDAATPTARIEHESGSDVAHPRIVARQLDDPHHRWQARARVAVLARRDADGHRLAGGNCSSDRGEGVLRRAGAEPPVVGALGPQQPAAIVRREFAGHGEAVARRARRQRRGHRNLRARV